MNTHGTPQFGAKKRGKRKWIFMGIFALMAFSGFGQMPIFKRYYIADIPGMGWAADFYLTHYIHYLGAIVLLGFFSYVVTDYLISGRLQYRLRTLLLLPLTVAGFAAFTWVADSRDGAIRFVAIMMVLASVIAVVLEKRDT